MIELTDRTTPRNPMAKGRKPKTINKLAAMPAGLEAKDSARPQHPLNIWRSGSPQSLNSPESLNPQHIFSHFIVGSHNRFALAAAHAVAEAPGQAYNPLYIFSDYGPERTYLLHCIGNEILRRDVRHRVLYTTAETFVNDLSSSHHRYRGAQAEQKYRNVDSLLIDDIEHLADHPGAMKDFLRLFEALYEAEKQIVISSYYSPRELPNMIEDLRSRFEWGLIADVEPLDIETITAILRWKADIRKIRLPSNVAVLIATELSSAGEHRAHSFRFVENLLWQLEAFAKGSPLNLKLARRFLTSANLEDIFTATVGKTVQVVNATPHLLDLLRKDYSLIHSLPPDKVELITCDRLSKMGFDVHQVGSTYSRDGGIDIVAVPAEPAAFPFLLAVQVKHHLRASRKTGPSAVKDLQSVVLSTPFNAGLLVTSTTFTPDARWFAENHHNLVRLRDMHDLKRWVWDDFADPAEWREIPSEIKLAGTTIKIPRRY